MYDILAGDGGLFYMVTDVTKAVVEGGPASGKSSAFPYVQERFSNFSCPVFQVREVATHLIESGVVPDGPWFSKLQFERLVIDRQIEREEFYEKVAKTTGAPKALVLCDRGLVGVRFFLENDRQYEALLKEYGLDPLVVALERYKIICHLRSIACDNPELYRQIAENNPARMEKDPTEAAKQDDKLLALWNKCEHVRIIDNSTDFLGKMKRLTAALCRVVGIPVPLEIERKYLVDSLSFDIRRFPVPIYGTLMHQAYLDTTGKRIRKRGLGNSFVYYETQKEGQGLIRQESSRSISEKEFRQLYARRHKDYDPIIKMRYCFVWENQYFELDVMTQPISITLLEIELTEENDKIELPPFIRIIQDVTENPKFKNQAIAHKNSPLRDTWP